MAAHTVVSPSWQQEYWAQVDHADWDAAIASAEQLVAAARPASADTALRLSEALSLLGGAQLNKGNLVAAEAAFSESLQVAEKHSSRSSEALVDPLRGLGFTLAAEGKHEQAIPYMDRALLLSRRSGGLFDISQQSLLRQLAASLTATGAPADAEHHMLYLRRLGEHAYGADDPQQIPILCAVGDWYVEVGRVDIARQNYRTAISIAERKLGKNNIGILDPLRSLAASYPREIMLSYFGIVMRGEKLTNIDPNAPAEGEPMNPRYLSTEGERALIRSLKVLQANPNSSLKTQVGTLVQAGDWFVMKQQPDKAMVFYKAAAKMLADPGAEEAPAKASPTPTEGTAEENMDEVGSPLSFPVQIFYPTPPVATRYLNLPRGMTEDRFVQVAFTVQPDSTVTDVRVTDKDTSERQASQVADAMRAARYRPRFVDGEPVATTDVGYRQIIKVRADNREAG